MALAEVAQHRNTSTDRLTENVTRHPSPTPKQRFESLDGLRGIAALVVVFTHSMLALPHYWNVMTRMNPEARHSFDWVILDTPLRLLIGGENAVTLFFVLSGFVLSLPWISGNGRSYGTFFVSRLCRIYLPYVAAMLIAGALATKLGNVIAGASFWVNYYAWANHVTPYTVPSVLLMLGNNYSAWIDNPTWTLVWEMRVSLLFPLLVVPVARWGMKGAVAVAIGLWSAFTWGAAVESALPDASSVLGNPHQTFYYAAFFLLGIVLARYRFSLMRVTWAPLVLVVAGLAAWLVTWQADIMRAAGAALLIVAAISNGLPRRFLSTTPIQWLGRVSYSLYLIHVPVFLVAEHLIYPKLPHVLIIAISIPTALVLAEIFHRTIEQPAHELGRSMVRRMTTPCKTDNP
jgi:peptidoglycan/LPS O-acetylase OafA/YrhL